MTNDAQIEHWSGVGGERWAADAAHFDRMLRPYLDRLLDGGDLQTGERVIDVGCGPATSSLAAADAVGPDGTVLGVDISRPLLEVGRLRVTDAGLHNVELLDADAQTHLFAPGRADVVLSRFGVMFFDDPVAAFANLSVALRPGGRLVFVCWRDALENEWITEPAAVLFEHFALPADGPDPSTSPFSLARSERIHEVLGSAGFGAIQAVPFDVPTWVGATPADTAEFFRGTELARTLTEGAPEDRLAEAWRAVTDRLGAHQSDDGIVLGGSAWLVSATRP